MKKLVIGALFLVIVFSSSCRLFPQKTEGKPPIKIGVLSPFSGPGAVFGEDIKKGVELAMATLADQKIAGRTVQTLYEDDQGNPVQALTAMKKLVDIDGTRLIIGPLYSSCKVATAPYIGQNKVLAVSPNIGDPSLATGSDGYLFQTEGSIREEAEFIANFVVQKLHAKKAVIFHNDNDWGQKFNDYFTETFTKQNGEIIHRFPLPAAQTDFKAELAIAKQADLDVLLTFYGGDSNFRLINAIHELGLPQPIVGTYSLDTQDFIKISRNTAEGVIFSAHVDKENLTAAQKDFYQKNIARYGNPNPSAAVSAAYDSFMLIKQAIEYCGSEKDTTCLKDYLYTIKDYAGASGNLTIKEDGTVQKPLVMKTIKDGHIVNYAQL